MRRLRFLPVYAILAALIVLPATGCSLVDDDLVSSDFHAAYPNPPAMLEVDNSVGSITIGAWDKPSVEIDANRRGPTADAVSAIKIAVERRGPELAVNTVFPTSASNLKVDYTIHAPAKTALKLEQSVGTIQSAGFTGSVEEHTSTGTIETSMAALGGSQRVNISVSVGAIKLTLPSNTDAAITANTSVGAVQSDFPLSVDRTVVGQYAQGKVGSGSAVVDLTIATGAIRILRE